MKEYPSVQGMQKDVFFLNHRNKENGTEDSVSKFNMFEVWPLVGFRKISKGSHESRYYRLK